MEDKVHAGDIIVLRKFRYKMKLVFYLLLIVSIGSCKSILGPNKYSSGIPGQSTKVIASTNSSADSLFHHIAKSLGKAGWIVSSSKEAMQIHCDSKLVEQGVYIRPIIKIRSITPDSSVATYMGTWSKRPSSQALIDYFLFVENNNIKRIRWEGSKTKGGQVFKRLEYLARKTTDNTKTKISFSK